MTDAAAKKLCLALIAANTEAEIVRLLKAEGLWAASDAWLDYGGEESNFSSIGNQQSRPDAALVEKIVNSVDAVLMGEARARKIDPSGPDAPQSIQQALEAFFGMKDGRVTALSTAKRADLARNIAVVTSGSKAAPCITIIDRGEGQSPASLPATILSINRSNKLRIPFVQGKFNMGGTGALGFCGTRNLQVVVSRRRPDIADLAADPTADRWAVTVVRRLDPTGNVRSSKYQYLAPAGKIASFHAESLSVLPGKYPSPTGQPLEYGTYIKLIEYQLVPARYRTNLVFDLNYRLAVLMPTLGLPVRLFERRPGFSGHTFESTLAGLTVRLDDDTRGNLEPGFPTSATVAVAGSKLSVGIYAFKDGASDKFIDSEGVIFTINGQTHGSLPQTFFTRNSVRLGYLEDSVLLIVDCSALSGRSREDLFMNSRDRLREGAPRQAIVRELEDLLRNHAGLRELANRRRQEKVKKQLEADRPLEKTLKKIIRKSPALSRLLGGGTRIPNPFRLVPTGPDSVYEGKKFPELFELARAYSADSPKSCHANMRFRVELRTDARNDYLDRDASRGTAQLTANGRVVEEFALNLWNGTANLTVELPVGAKEGDLLDYRLEVTDETRIEPFVNQFHVRVIAPAERGGGPAGRRKPPGSRTKGPGPENEDGLSLPNIVEVAKADWDAQGFDKFSALKVRPAADEGYDFYVNVDNVHLLSEMKRTPKADAALLKARFVYGLVLAGLALLQDDDEENETEDGEERDKCADVARSARALAPVLLPLVGLLAELTADAEKDEDDAEEIPTGA